MARKLKNVAGGTPAISSKTAESAPQGNMASHSRNASTHHARQKTRTGGAITSVGSVRDMLTQTHKMRSKYSSHFWHRHNGQQQQLSAAPTIPTHKSITKNAKSQTTQKTMDTKEHGQQRILEHCASIIRRLWSRWAVLSTNCAQPKGFSGLKCHCKPALDISRPHTQHHSHLHWQVMWLQPWALEVRMPHRGHFWASIWQAALRSSSSMARS
mmetsp:Transcript_31909/g.87863  ORF Transcript_31909/g.87863 Transcript_31909/m.87863 type:complete len:213 (-) Transcript_31909:433-1071(-)